MDVRASSAQSNPRLVDALRADIRAAGGQGIPFATFMERALYHPEWGYYAEGTARVGRAGDFFTSVSVGECFGMLMASHVADAREQLPGDGDFWIFEQGANDGSLARDILLHLRRRLSVGAFARVRYGIVEPFPRLIERQEATLGEAFEGKVTHYADLGKATGEAERGIFLCNELLDAFPVHRVVFKGGRWREIQVVEAGEGFAEAEAELSTPRLSEALAGVDVTEGYRTEICLGVDGWLAAVAGLFERGLVTVIDYGLTEAAYFAPERNEGTLRAYRGHQLVENVFESVGERDLTAHVNFTRVARSARANGLEVLGFADQCFFLVGQAAEWMREVQAAGAPDAATSKLLRQFQTLIHPGLMGRAFQVLTLGKNLPEDAARLSGFRHGRNNVAALD